MAKPLPPLPVPQKRVLTPPPRQSGTFDVDTDAATPRRPVELAAYQSLLSVFDQLSPEQRAAFTEFGFLFRGLGAEQLRELLDRAVEMNGLA
jgi:hypothetical protein